MCGILHQSKTILEAIERSSIILCYTRHHWNLVCIVTFWCWNLYNEFWCWEIWGSFEVKLPNIVWLTGMFNSKYNEPSAPKNSGLFCFHQAKLVLIFTFLQNLKDISAVGQSICIRCILTTNMLANKAIPHSSVTRWEKRFQNCVVISLNSPWK